MIQPNSLTLISPVIHNQHELLHLELRKIKDELIASKHELFESIGKIHYARWVILEPTEVQGEKLLARLAFISNYDHETNDYLKALSTAAAPFIDRIYKYCEGYPDEAARTTQTRQVYLTKYITPIAASFAGAPQRTLAQIRRESALRNFIRSYLNSQNWQGQTAIEVYKNIKEKVRNHTDFKWMDEPVRIPKVSWADLFFAGIIILLLLPFILIWLLIIQFFYERHDTPLGLTPSQVNEPHLRKLEEYEDLENQNQFTQVLVMKPGAARRLTLNGFLMFSRQLIKYLFVNGKLMGIPTIHFAQWVMIDNQKRMLFLSNFDGSWQQYLGDFIDKSGWGLTAIWSNTIGFPKTEFSFFKGAYDEEHFLAWSRYYEVQTQLWYCAYPDLSIKNIVNNTQIRIELMKDLTEKQAKNFLKRF